MWRCDSCGTMNRAEDEVCTVCGARPESVVRSRKVEADEIAISAPGVDTGITFEDIDLGQPEFDGGGLIGDLDVGGDEIILDDGEAEKAAGDIAVVRDIRNSAGKTPTIGQNSPDSGKDAAEKVKAEDAKAAAAKEIAVSETGAEKAAVRETPVRNSPAKESSGKAKAPEASGGRMRQPETGGRARRIWIPIIVVVIAAIAVAAVFLAQGSREENGGTDAAYAPAETGSADIAPVVSEDAPEGGSMTGMAGGGIGNSFSGAGGMDAFDVTEEPVVIEEPAVTDEPAANEVSAGDSDMYDEGTLAEISGNMADETQTNDADMEAAPMQTAAAELLPTAEPVDEQAKQYYADAVSYLTAGDEDMALYCFMQADGYEDSGVYVRSIMLERAGSISTGLSHSLWTNGGSVSVNGNNFYGQCNVSAWPGSIRQVAAGKYHSVGLDADGRLWFAGDSYYGQCTDRGWQNVESVAAGAFHTVALMSDGTVAAVGQDIYGQCAVGSWSGAMQVAAGERHTAALLTDGRVVAAGDNSYGQLNVSGWTDVVQIACGPFHTVALRSDGTVLAAGLNDAGQCDVQAVTDAVYVAAGDGFTVCVLEDGSVIDIAASHGDRVNGSWRYVLGLSAGGGHAVGMFPDGSLMLSGSYFTALEQGANAKGDIYDVVTLQRAMADRGYFDSTVNGQYDGSMTKAVAAAQADMGLEPTGVADESFQLKLYSGYMK